MILRNTKSYGTISTIFLCYDPFEKASASGKPKSGIRKELARFLRTKEGKTYLFPGFSFLPFPNGLSVLKRKLTLLHDWVVSSAFR